MEFEAKDKRYIYCSIECRKQQYRKKYMEKYIPKLTYNKTCPTCKTVFETKYSQQIYCKNCIIERPKKEREIKTVICQNCLKPFLTSTREKYCSPECWESYHKAHRPHVEKLKQKNVCLWCHGEFLTFYQQKYCCGECGAEFRRMQQRICKTYPFQNDKKDKFLGELEKQGKDFQIKVRELIID
jgi:hypothetical protein